MKIKSFAITALTALFAFCSFGCGYTGTTVGAGKADVEEKTKPQTEVTEDTPLPENAFRITLYPEYAPITCENFEKLVSTGFYDGVTFHRVVEDFMAQGGDPQGTGMGGSKEKIKGEFSSNGVNNTLSHTRGVVSMARSSAPNSASSQFFICYSDKDTFLDGNYAAFGKVTEGMEVVDSFLKVKRVTGSDGAISSPTTKIIIDKATIISKDAEGHTRCQFVMKDFLPKETETTAPATTKAAETTTTAAESTVPAGDTTAASGSTTADASTSAAGSDTTATAGSTTAETARGWISGGLAEESSASSAAETTTAAESTTAAAAESTTAAASSTAA